VINQDTPSTTLDHSSPWRNNIVSGSVLGGLAADKGHIPDNPPSHCKPVGLYRGALPRTPARPRRWDANGVISSPGQAQP
jgi:hypothetical protein